MLALTRRVGEEVVLGDPRKPLGVIRVVEIHGDKVRLSFDFPRDVAINRRELADQKAKAADGGSAAPTSPTPGTHTPLPPESISHGPRTPPPAK